MDCIFLHVPKKIEGYQEILKMPLGLTTFSWLLKKNGFSSKILHLSIEELVNKDFRIEDYVRSQNIKIVCMDLHWHPQSFRVIETAKAIKRSVNDCRIVLGGFTATLFAEEILRSHQEIDFIIKGDAEIPLLELIKALKDQAAFDKIPNLVWRGPDKVIENKQSYVIDQKTLDELEFWHLDLINNFEIYNKLYDYEGRLDKTSIDRIKKGRSFAYYSAGRGCPVNCSFCGGANKSQCLINKRKTPIFKSIQSVINDLKGIKTFDIENIYTSFDPYPKRDYYLKLFEAIRAAGLKYDMYFESWDLPPQKFIDSFSETFGKDSYIIISPDSGSEKVRKLNKGYYYTNQQLLDNLDRLYAKKIKGQLYFSVGFPFEEQKDVDQTLDLMILIKSKYEGFFKLTIMPIELDPGSPMWLDSKKYKVTPERQSFADLYQAHKETPTLGYRTDNFSSEEIINNFKMILKKLL